MALMTLNLTAICEQDLEVLLPADAKLNVTALRELACSICVPDLIDDLTDMFSPLIKAVNMVSYL